MRQSGAIIVDGHEVASTLQCCHCGVHWEVVHGSGRLRGWCSACKEPTCGAVACDPCVPFEARLEYTEALSADRVREAIRLHGRFPGIRPL